MCFYLVLKKGIRSSHISEDGRKAVYKDLNLYPEALLPLHWHIKSHKKRRRVGRKVKLFYFNRLQISDATLEQLVNVSVKGHYYFSLKKPSSKAD